MVLRKYYERENLGDGQMQHTQHLRPIAHPFEGGYRRDVNDWVDGGLDRPHIIRRSQFWVGVAADGRRRIYPTKELARYFEVGAPRYLDGTWKAPALGSPARYGNTLVWTKAAASMQVAYGGHWVNQDLYLTSPAFRPTKWAWPLTMVGLNRSGLNILADGVVVMRARRFVLRDDADPRFSRTIPHELARIGGQWHVIITPDYTGTTSPIIDPTLELQPDGAAGLDTRLAEWATGNNWGVWTFAAAGAGDPAGGNVGRELIQFDVSSLPSAAIISSATMSIYLESESDPANYDIAAHRGLVQWYEGDGNGAPPSGDGSTWALRNNNGAVAWTGGAGGASGTEFDAVATATVAIDGTWQDFNVLADVADFVSGAETNYGWWLLGEEGVANSNKRFFSSDHATAGTRPKLVVVYAVPSGLAGTGPRARGRGRGR